MLFYQIAFALSLLLLFATKAAVVLAVRNGDAHRARVLKFFRLGLGLSSCSYLIHLLYIYPLGLMALASLFSCLLGTILIYVGWMEYWSLLQKTRLSSAAPSAVANPLSHLAVELGLPPLDDAVAHVLWHAQEEAAGRRQSGVDTDHLLLGLLREPRSAGAQLLSRLGVNHESLARSLGGLTVPDRRTTLPSKSPLLPLTQRARQVFDLARQEAHRLGSTLVGTEHLLLGLVLMGTGAAAVALFQEGVTVDRLRNEIWKSRVPR